jgi:cobaltochelatase CobN
VHLIANSSTSLDEIVEPVDLGQSPGEVLVLSFADSDLTGLAAAWSIERNALPSVRLAHLRDLRHPMSVDLWIEKVASHAKVILVRLLGGFDWWRYGIERLSVLAREHAIALALLPGEDRDDPRLFEASTLGEAELVALLALFREGGCENMRALLRRLARYAGADLHVPAPRAIPRVGAYLPGRGAVSLDLLVEALASQTRAIPPPLAGTASAFELSATATSSNPSPEGGGWRAKRAGWGQKTKPYRAKSPHPIASLSLRRSTSPALRGRYGPRLPLDRGAALEFARPVIAIIFYRALLLAADTRAIDELCAALAARGLAPAPLVITGFKDTAAAQFIRTALKRLSPAAVLTTTAFAVGAQPGEPTALDETDVPILQVVMAVTKRAAWCESPRGLGAADLAMHVVLPELDGRVLAGTMAFKAPVAPQDELAFTALWNRPEPDRVGLIADRVAELVRLQATACAARRIAVLMPHYAGAPGREGYAVGLDVPASVLALLEDLRAAGYHVRDMPPSSRALLEAVEAGDEDCVLPLEAYARLAAELPPDAMARCRQAWGDPSGDGDVRDGAFRFRARAFGKFIVALAPDRGRSLDRRADYHDLTLPPRHALLAFGLWLRHVMGVHALVHMGAHGTLEWLPGKAVALTSSCFPEIMTGALPVIYPFIVSNPGEAAQAKRRIAGVTIGHLPPPLVAGELSGAARELERLVDEYAQADGLDRKRRERLAALILDAARRSGIAQEAGLADELAPLDALRRIDAWVCDLKELAIKDGLHVYGRFPPSHEIDPDRQCSAAAERAAVLCALDGRRVAPGPAGAPSRGRRDVLPTGRNLYTADPRMLPTPTAMELGALAADEVIRTYLQTHGEMPRVLIIDLWGSATLRTGGEEIAQGLAFMGCRPTWDHATGRVTGIEVPPVASIGRPRIDVTWRISGLFRDLFPAQIALLDAAVRAVAGRDEADEDNPLAAAARCSRQNAAPALARIFGTAPGAYGAGIEDLLGRESERDALGAAYLEAASHAYGGAEGAGRAAPDQFAGLVGKADLLVHPSDDPGRDLLEGAEDTGFVGGFAAAAAMLGRAPDLIMLDATDPRRPRARQLSAALARIVRGRVVNPRFIAGLMRHGPRGAAELAETVDRLVDFAETTGQVSSALFDLVHAAYVADRAACKFLRRENPAAARVVAERLGAALSKGLWHPCRNDIALDLKALAMEVAP